MLMMSGEPVSKPFVGYVVNLRDMRTTIKIIHDPIICRPVPKPHCSGLLLSVCEISDPILLLSAISSRFTASSGLLEE